MSEQLIKQFRHKWITRNLPEEKRKSILQELEQAIEDGLACKFLVVEKSLSTPITHWLIFEGFDVDYKYKNSSDAELDSYIMLIISGWD